MKSKLSRTQQANIQFHRYLAASYDHQPFFRPENRKRVRDLLTVLSREAGSDRLLDVGCGTGFILDLAHDLFRKAEGIDLTREMLARVKPHSNVTLTLGQAEHLPYRSASFNVVTCYSVLHHIEDLSAMLTEIRRVLRPGGVFYADESPSQHYRDLVLQNHGRPGHSPYLSAELRAVICDMEKYEALYGIPQDTTRQAMVQSYDKHLLLEDSLRGLLERVGFGQVQIDYRRFISQGPLEKQYGLPYVNAVEHYLQEMMPLSRAFFKYFVLVAK